MKVVFFHLHFSIPTSINDELMSVNLYVPLYTLTLVRITETDFSEVQLNGLYSIEGRTYNCLSSYNTSLNDIVNRFIQCIIISVQLNYSNVYM